MRYNGLYWALLAALACLAFSAWARSEEIAGQQEMIAEDELAPELPAEEELESPVEDLPLFESEEEELHHDERSSCRVPNVGSGTCKYTSSGCGGGSFIPGHCPGPTNFQCCVKSATPGVGRACSVPGLGSGVCQLTSTSCSGGTYRAGYCPGPSNVRCCVKGSPPPSGGGGNCPAYRNAGAERSVPCWSRAGAGNVGCCCNFYVEAKIGLKGRGLGATYSYPRTLPANGWCKCSRCIPNSVAVKSGHTGLAISCNNSARTMTLKGANQACWRSGSCYNDCSCDNISNINISQGVYSFYHPSCCR